MNVRAVATRRGLRTAPLFWAITPLLLGGCVATKSDVRRIETNIARLEARQDSLAREVARQNRILMDSIESGSELVRMVRGQLTDQLRQLQEMMVTTQQLLGQSQQRINELRADLARAEQERQQQFSTPAGGAAPVAGGEDPEELYRIGTEQLTEGNYATAEAAFRSILQQNPTHARAVDAQFSLAETLYKAGNLDDATKEFDQVVEQFPGSTERASQALLRAGNIAEEQKKTRAARTYYERVIARYKDTDAASEARRRLNRLR